MALQSQNLVMLGLGVKDDVPPNPAQSPLVDGIHLRWAFKRELGFPLYGFYLWRRRHRAGTPLCLSDALNNLQAGPRPSSRLDLLDYGQISSDENLYLTGEFNPPGGVAFELTGRSRLRFTLPPGEPARRVELRLGFREEANIEVNALLEEVSVLHTTVSGAPGEVASLTLEFEAVTAVEIKSGPAALVEVCFVPVSQEATAGWEEVPNFPYPLCLPVAHPAYPCSAGKPVDFDSINQERVTHALPPAWDDRLSFIFLQDQLTTLVAPYSGNRPMADRTLGLRGAAPQDPNLTVYPLDLILLSSLHPAIAQLVGLYWVDQTAASDVAYDYLVAADYEGAWNGDAGRALSHIQGTGFHDADGYIVFNKRLAQAPPLPAPTNLRLYALPGQSIHSAAAGGQEAGNNVGLRWDQGAPEEVDVLLPNRALMYHLWRADLGQTEPAAAPPADAYTLLTDHPPVLASALDSPPPETPDRPPDWPPFPLQTIDPGLADGWYSYQVSGVDIFGRGSPRSAAGVWRQWTPAPAPRPWYYQDAPADATVQPFAVRLLDKVPPPAPTAVEAWTLDPADPTLLRDAAYEAWQTGLDPAERDTVVGLRVRWQWTQAHMRQAPDTREFRLYYHPGSRLPAPDYSLPANWQARYSVVGYDDHVTETTDADGQPVRQYEVFLPAPTAAASESLPLTPSLAEPVVYAYIGVSAADGKPHTADERTGAPWGDRPGNEGCITGPAKIFRVLRRRPPRPAAPPAADREYATPPDYHGCSFYTYRWRPHPQLKIHIFRALDDALFNVDWSHRPRPTLDPDEHLQFFPDPQREPRWDPLKRRQVADALNRLNSFNHDLSGTAQAMAYYRTLSDDALRILAGLPGNEPAFIQITSRPLDPADPAVANRAGPDNPPDFAVDQTLRAYVDTLDGGAANRYLYRAASVDGAHNRSALSLAGSPVNLPDVRPPAKPQLLAVRSDTQQVTLTWQAPQAPDMDRYLVYRAETEAASRDVRLMGPPVANLPAAPLTAAGKEVDLGPGVDIIRAERVYAAAGFDPTADLLTGQTTAQYLVEPAVPTGSRIQGLTAPDGAAVVVVYRDSDQGLQYTPSGNAPRVWVDYGLAGGLPYYYRLVATRQGETAAGKVLLTSTPSDPGVGRPLPPPTFGIPPIPVDFSQIDSLPDIMRRELQAEREYIIKQLMLSAGGLDAPDLAPDLALTDFLLSREGWSGSIEGHWSPTITGLRISGPGAGTLFGLPFGLRQLAASLAQTVPVEIEMKGDLALPFFDQIIAVRLGMDATGAIYPALDSPTGSVEFTISSPAGEILHVEIDRLTVAHFEEGPMLGLGGRLTPRLGNLAWPTLTFDNLFIDPAGDIHLAGGRLDLRRQAGFDFHGFRLEITKLGFGRSETGGKWIGFFGPLKLTEGLPAGVSPHGLQLIWDEADRSPRFTFDEIHLAFEAPAALRYQGSVSYQPVDLEGQTTHRFAGDVHLELPTPGLEIDAPLTIVSDGASQTANVAAVTLNLQLPAGLPLRSSGLAVYELAGLAALHLAPDKRPAEAWSGPGPDEGWAKRPPAGATGIAQKWVVQPDSLALGAEVILGTTADNGYIFSGRMALVMTFPGPILLLEGEAQLLEERATPGETLPFRVKAVLDGRDDDLLIGLAGRYKAGPAGRVIDIGGGEALFDLDDAGRWRLALGRPAPRAKQGRAELFQLFEGNSYLTLNANRLALGARMGYDPVWSFGLLDLRLKGWLESDAVVSGKPVHFSDDLRLHGQLGLTIFGFTVGFRLDVPLAAEAPYPFHILARLNLGRHAVRFWPDFAVRLLIEWSESDSDPPPLARPLQEIAIEHFKVSAGWPLPRNRLLIPDYDPDADGFLEASPPTEELQDAPPPAETPVVPVDCRPHLTFGRTVHDDALVGINPQPVLPYARPAGWEWIGNPAKNEGPARVRYGLKEIALHKYSHNTWSLVAGKGAAFDGAGVPPLFGSWAPTPHWPSGAAPASADPPVANVKLWLWSKSPFDYTRHGGRAWNTWFTDRFADYPCGPPPTRREICYDFEELPASEPIASPWAHPAEPGLIFSWTMPADRRVETLAAPVGDRSRALCFTAISHPDRQAGQLNTIILALPRPTGIVRLLVRDRSGVRVTGYDAEGHTFGPFEEDQPDDRPVEIAGQAMVRVVIEGGPETCLIALCLVAEPKALEPAYPPELMRRLAGEIERWSEPGIVLEPHTTYRLTVTTTVEKQEPSPSSAVDDAPVGWEQRELAYFRTEGPPGLTRLSRPIGYPQSAEFISGLTDLVRYVDQTTPPARPARGQKLRLPRPVYRAYDVGLTFNENYVDLMYRLARRELGLYLYDANNQPARDVWGRVIDLDNRWGATEGLHLTAGEERWLALIEAGQCAALDPAAIPPPKTITGSLAGEVLEPDMVHEVRLRPLPLHEDFTAFAVGTTVAGPGGSLGQWTVRDEVDNGGPSSWRIDQAGEGSSRYIVQTANVGGGSLDPQDPHKPGALLVWADNPALPATHPEQPGRWTDYRLSVRLRPVKSDEAIGLVFRYRDAGNYYRFSMNRRHKYRRLVRVVKGVPTILAEDNFVYQQNQTYPVAVEAIGSSLRLYQAGELVFAVTDSSIDQGRIGLYCRNNPGAHFSEIRVDDFSQTAPILYRFKFITSHFANFFHHLHSFQDETRRLTLPLDNLPAAAAGPAIMPTEAETRAYTMLAEQVSGPARWWNPPEVQITRLEPAGGAAAFLIRSPEPLDWGRIRLQVLQAKGRGIRPVPPTEVKLTDVALGTTRPNEERVTLLLRRAIDLTGYRLEYRRFPAPVAEAPGDPILFLDEFEREESGLLFQETFGPNALDHYTIVDEGHSLAPSTWSVTDNHISQTSNIYGGSLTDPAALDKPGTLALTGSPAWGNIRLSATLRSEDDDDAIGVVFRYQDGDHYYRFSMDRDRSYRRLVKKVAGLVSLLWEDDVAYTQGHSYQLVIELYQDRLVGYLDNIMLFNVRDESIGQGRVGFYSWSNSSAHFEALQVEALEKSPVLWQPAVWELNTVDRDEVEASASLPAWSINGGAWPQSTRPQADNGTGVETERPGVFAVGGDVDWQDIGLSARLSDNGANGAVGLMVRVRPHQADATGRQDYDYYHLAIDRTHSRRRLVKKVGDQITVLWEDTETFTLQQSYELTIRAVGDKLGGYLDGDLLFTVYDRDLKQGQVGLSWTEAAPHFERMVVTEQTRQVSRWMIRDEGVIDSPSVWRLSVGVLQQTSRICGGVMLATDPDKLGTQAIAGDSAWTDYRVSVRLRSDDKETVGLIFRYQDDDNYYRLSLDGQCNSRYLIKKENGVVRELWWGGGSYTAGEPFTLTIDAIGGWLVGYQGDDRLFRLYDTAHAAGRIGLYSWANTGARFEWVEVRRPPLEAYALLSDRFAAGDLTGWRIVDEGTHWTPSDWQPFEGMLRQSSDIFSYPSERKFIDKRGTQAIAGDPYWQDIIFSARLQAFNDDALGLLFRYADENNYYRFSMDRQRKYRRLVKNVDGVFTLLWEDRFAFELGRPYDLTIVARGRTLRGYMDGVPVFKVEDGDRIAGEIGLYSWANKDARFGQVRVYPADLAFDDWLLEETFERLVPGRWTFVDEGQRQGPSCWEVREGALHQRSDIWGGQGRGSIPDKPGTYALAGDSGWTDYRVSVRLRSDGNDGLGVMVRYQDSDNYYRFSMDRERRYRRLIKKVAGQVEVLWEDDVQYRHRRDYILTIDCQGEQLTGYLDGVPLFSVEDGALASGRIALYCWRNSKAHFSEVRVSAPLWLPYYSFGGAERLPAGTQVQLLAGNAAQAPAAGPTVVRRFSASPGTDGRLRLPAGGVDLRVVEPDETKAHTRRFLPDSAYTPVEEARVIRKADGTGFFVIAPEGSAPAEGQYRLKMQYRRNNKHAEPDSQILSQAGDRTPEEVTLDIPWRTDE